MEWNTHKSNGTIDILGPGIVMSLSWTNILASSAKTIADFNSYHEDEHNRYNVYVYTCRPLCESVYKSFGHVQNKVCNSYMSTINYLHCSLSEFWIDFHGYLSDIIDCRFYLQFREFMVVIVIFEHYDWPWLVAIVRKLASHLQYYPQY